MMLNDRRLSDELLIPLWLSVNPRWFPLPPNHYPEGIRVYALCIIVAL